MLPFDQSFGYQTKQNPAINLEIIIIRRWCIHRHCVYLCLMKTAVKCEIILEPENHLKYSKKHSGQLSGLLKFQSITFNFYYIDGLRTFKSIMPSVKDKILAGRPSRQERHLKTNYSTGDIEREESHARDILHLPWRKCTSSDSPVLI